MRVNKVSRVKKAPSLASSSAKASPPKGHHCAEEDRMQRALSQHMELLALEADEDDEADTEYEVMG